MSGKKKYTREFLISELERFEMENGRQPKQKDMKISAGYPQWRVFVNMFGSWDNCLKECGFKSKKYNKEVLLADLHRFVDEFGRIPTCDDMNNTPGYASASAYRTYFKTWNLALSEANLEINIAHEYTYDELKSDIDRFVKENDKVPTQNEMTRKNGYISQGPYVHMFGTFNKALEEFGYKPNRILHEYDGTETCSVCGRNWTRVRWNYDDDDNRQCDRCSSRIRFKNNPDKVKLYKHTHESKRRGYGSVPLNNVSAGLDGHHTWIESSDFVVFYPCFLHQLHSHNHNKQETMITPNALAFDYWIQEDSLYKNLYLEGEP